MTITKGKKKGNKPIINYNNKEGWENYAKISDKHAPRIEEAVSHASDSNAMQTEIDDIQTDIELEAFGKGLRSKEKGKSLYLIA